MTPTSPCRRWLIARLALASTATLWVILYAPALILPALLTLISPLAAHLDPTRARAWLETHTFTLSALLVASLDPLLVALGAAALPTSTLALFTTPAPRPPHLSPLLRATLAAALSLVLALIITQAPSAALAAPLAAFLSTRPLAALGEVFRALALHHGPVDPLLAWRPITSPTPGGGA